MASFWALLIYWLIWFTGGSTHVSDLIKAWLVEFFVGAWEPCPDEEFNKIGKGKSEG
jgi:hypothetical protein